MERFAVQDAGVLPNVFTSIWCVVAGGLGDNRQRTEWILGDYRRGGADFPVDILMEFDEDEWNVPIEHQCETVGDCGTSGGDESWLGRVAQGTDASEILSGAKCLHSVE